ncbi:MAG: divergent PAP2 family protein [Treponema sp.]|jgi:acid phosphatase family membrane protein YuiD|nr:divergent PAP2 family protein [Treponema sp.]
MSVAISLKAASLRFFFENPIFLSSVSSLFIAQLLKAVIYVLSARRRRTRELVEILAWRTGGMPSSHAALVCALSTSIAFAEGLASNLFVFSLFFAMIILRDAMGARRSVGLQARSLNLLGKQAAEKTGLDFHAVKEIRGHSPIEVVVGSLLGVFIAAGFSLL